MEGKYKAWQVDKFKGDPVLRELNHKPLEDNQLLVKIKCSTIHPADLAIVAGQHGVKPSVFPFTAGLEGSGIIENVGSSLDKSLIGKRTGVIGKVTEKEEYNGTWAEYTYCTYDQLLVFEKELPFEEICFSTINPFTAIAWLHVLKVNNKTAAVQNGASSAFGKMFSRLCVKENIELINVVRKDSHFATFKEMGIKYMFSTSDKNWEEELKKTAEGINATVCFECVGGDYTGRMLECLPYNSTLYHFGNLELKRLGKINTKSLTMDKKTIRGLIVDKVIEKMTEEERKKIRDYIINDYENGGKIFSSSSSKEFKLENFVEGFMYYLQNMSAGKVIFKS